MKNLPHLIDALIGQVRRATVPVSRTTPGAYQNHPRSSLLSALVVSYRTVASKLQFNKVFKKFIRLLFTFALHTTVMRYAMYPVIVRDEYQTYEFCSVGQRGSIQKAVIYTQIQGNLYNLAFGDWNEGIQKLDDSVRSNNGDRDKVLATVAYTALDFTNQFPSAQLFIEGSTAARTRLYQMGISNNLHEITLNFNVKGYLDGHWQQFLPGRNYKAFLILRKSLLKFDT